MQRPLPTENEPVLSWRRPSRHGETPKLFDEPLLRVRERPDRTTRLLRAADGFALVQPTEPELRLLHRWLDCWRGVGDIVTGMQRQGYEVSIGDHGGQWIAIFYAGHRERRPRG